MGGDPGEGRQHAGGVHALSAALGVHGGQHVVSRRGRVHPCQRPGDAEPGLVEVHDLAGQQRLDDRADGGLDDRGDLLHGGGDDRRGRRAAEHLAESGAGPVPRQELAVPQVRAERGQPRPVLRRRGHPVRGVRAGPRPAARALPLDHLMLGHDRPHLRDLGDLTPLRPCLHAAGEPGTAAAAVTRLMHHHVIRVICQFHRRARLPLRAAGLAALLAQRLRRRLGEPVRRWRPAGIPRVLLHLRGQGLHPGLQLGDLRHLDLQRRDDLVLLGQQLPQPRIRGTQPLAGGTQPRDHLIRRLSLTGHTGRTGHNRHTARAGPQ